MNLFDSAMNGFSSFISSAKKPKSFVDGEKFEEYIRENIFSQDYYKILSKTHNYDQNSKDFVESSRLPDYEFQPYDSKYSFYVECKYKDITETNNKIEDVLDEHKLLNRILSKEEQIKADQLTKPYSFITIANELQFIRYKELNNTKDVIFALGLYDDNFGDISIYLIPAIDLITNTININFIDGYVISNCHPVIPPKIYDLSHYSDGYCIRCKKEIDSGIFCFDCWKSWYKYKNYSYIEKHCNECGNDYSVSAAKPVCLNCFKNTPF